MNTLTSILEWVETSPAQGIQAIEALATELRALSEVSGERCISMSRELALCRAHLEVMGFRQAVQFTLTSDGVDLDAPIPPAVIHTLIENAITHNAYEPGRVTFILKETKSATQRHLTVLTPLSGNHHTKGSEGGGLRYIRARLEEAFPGNWRLHSEKRDNFWMSEIDIPLEARTS